MDIIRTGDYAWMGELETFHDWLHTKGLPCAPPVAVCIVVGKEVIVPIGLRVKRNLQDPWTILAVEMTNTGDGRVVAVGKEVFKA